jgi:hypothetical protein
MKRNILNYQGTKIGELELPDGTPESVWQAKLAPYVVAPAPAQSQKEKDYDRYFKRAQNKDKILAEMASENMERVRNAVWTTADLIALTQDVELKQVLDDVNTLSFELAVAKVTSITNPLITPAIKSGWIEKLSAHFYL